MPRPARKRTGGDPEAMEPTSITVPLGLLQWGTEYAKDNDRTFSSLVTVLLRREKRKTEENPGGPETGDASDAPGVGPGPVNSEGLQESRTLSASARKRPNARKS